MSKKIFYNLKKKILITGASGFLGSNIISKLSKNKSLIIHGLVKNTSKIKYRYKYVRYIKADITNLNSLKKKITENYDYIINFAGNINHKNRNQTYNAHFSGVKNLISVIDTHGLKLFIQIGSSLEYGDKKSPQDEKQICKPISHYGKSKLLSSNHIKKKIKNFIILRLYQVYGPFQKNNRLIPIVIDSCLKNKSFECTDGSQLRDFLYVDDFTNLIIKILKTKKILSGIYNVGYGKPIKVREIIKYINKKIGKGKALFGLIKMRKDEMTESYPDIKKVKKIFSWSPKINFRIGLKKTIKHYET